MYMQCIPKEICYALGAFLRLNYVYVTENAYIRNGTVTEITKKSDLKNESCCACLDYQIHSKTRRNL